MIFTLVYEDSSPTIKHKPFKTKQLTSMPLTFDDNNMNSAGLFCPGFNTFC